MQRRILNKWKQYKYRFVPWLILNMKDRSVRSVSESESEVISESLFISYLYGFLTKLHQQLNNGAEMEKYMTGLKVMKEITGFTVERAPTSLSSGGQGVKVTSGTIQPCTITSLYPGLIYEPHEPILFQSIGNSFIFRCADGVLLDGNDKGLSKYLYRSCRGRDSCWPLPACDDSWLTEHTICPLNVGQYVNNHNKQYPANVAYQEFNIPEDFPAHLRQYLPNNHSASCLSVPEGTQRLLRVVALVSLKEIKCGEELFSSYFTVVQ
ncbi:SET domain-containing protein 9-like [Physella acuta]|uniref:SET domain-containing protein 9-like n=1 Tax=Physella acuta TaxID=109671 RepID=UPI0027DB7BCE|nr:SET domain-containing protein 9-like [Physella acuta]XP_059172589.1 SET domain-containing protein 9-like [Physella acuta]